jgi:hypothetical protein
MLTEEQRKDADRLRHYIDREQLVAVMNDTKWQRLFKALESMQGWVEFRRKDVREDEHSVGRWDADLYYMLGGWENIEWLDIMATRATDHTEQLLLAVREAGVPFSRQEKIIRIWGYLRSGVSPRWEQV